jgi:hypothetical protein
MKLAIPVGVDCHLFPNSLLLLWRRCSKVSTSTSSRKLVFSLNTCHQLVAAGFPRDKASMYNVHRREIFARSDRKAHGPADKTCPVRLNYSVKEDLVAQVGMSRLLVTR